MKPRKGLKKGDEVTVWWLDAVGPCDLSSGETLPLVPAETRGVVWEVTEAYITLAPELIYGTEARAATSIPWGMIVRTKRTGP